MTAGRMYCFAYIQGNCSDVDEASPAITGSRGCNDSANVEMAKEHGGAADAIERGLHRRYATFEKFESELSGNHFVTNLHAFQG
jgi:hypothetical protein